MTRWQKVPLRSLPSLRLLFICDNLAGYKTPAFVAWLCQHSILPLYTPLGSSWLNMTESIQNLLKQRALAGQHPTHPQEIIDRFEVVARVWNQNPTPFEWGGKRTRRRQQARLACEDDVWQLLALTFDILCASIFLS